MVAGRSYCPKCKKQISWYDNIPILSYLFIQGKCRKCKKTISIQYPLVELLSVLSFVIAYFFYGATITTLLFIILALTFIIIFFVDLKHYIIPNSLTFPLMVLGFVKSFDPNLNEIFPNYINSLIGGVFGYGIIWSIIFLYKVLRNKEGMGLGDAKLLAAIGFWFGWISIPFIIFSSSIVALIAVLPSLINKSKKFKLSLKEKYSEVLSFLFSESSIIINKLLNDIEKNKIKPEVQNIDEASYTTLIKKQSASINWSEPSEVIFAKFRAFYNWPNLYSYHLGKRFIVNDLDLSDYKSEVAGKIEKINGSLYIHTSSNMLCIKIIQFSI